MNKKSGFTLAEVLVTLMIIGVIAAMTIPSLMQSTAKQEYVAALKKAISTVNQAMALNYALEGVGANEDPNLDFITRRMNVITGDRKITSGNGIYTSDGVYYHLSGTTITIDVNGEKKPNAMSTNDNIYDQFTLILDTNRNVARAAGGAASALYKFKDGGAN